jgi:hypothetical protein
VIMKTRALLIALTGAALIATAGGVAAASQGGPRASAGTAAAAAVPRCATQNLSAGLHGGQAGLGNHGFILTLTNTGNQSCSLDGYPGLGLENSRHKALTSHTFWGSTYFDHDPGRALIVLSPGETASADFAYGSDGIASHSVTATYLEITPPDDRTHLTVRLPGAPVLIYHGNLDVTAMARHTPDN